MLKAENLSRRVRQYRLQKRWTQAMLAEKLYVTPQTISKWEMGMAVPDIPNLCRLAEVLGVSTDGLLSTEVVQPLYIGIDGGGTKTAYVLCNGEGQVLRSLIQAGTNPNDHDIEVCVDRLLKALADLTAGFGGVAAISAGIAGCGLDHNRLLLQQRLEAYYPSVRISVCSDIDNVILCHFDRADTPCIAAICGTGSVVFAKDRKQRHRIGGWGYLLDGSGSGYDIGRDALTAVLAVYDGCGETTSLKTAIEKQLGGTLPDRLHTVYEGGKRLIASFAKLVFAECESGDPVAEQIIRKNMEGFAGRILQADKQFDVEKTVLLGGGVLHDSRMVERWLSPLLPLNMKVLLSELPPVYGACKAAVLTAGALSPDFSTRFAESYTKEVFP
ncbi:MAG: helix-turn-helix domain-containing protein [Clostridia bacterium]|nr:helix-turn-helix domain-containing protein [Clostridia bacterium]